MVISSIRNDINDITHFLAIGEDITLRKEMERQSIEISEQEQRRIGRDLHDSLGQELTGISMMSKVLAKKLKQKSISEAEEAEEISGHINNALYHIRNLSKGLYPARLEIEGLANTLQELTEFVQKLYKIKCTFTHKGWSKSIDASVDSHLFYIIREAVNNAVKHAKAKNINIDITARNHKVVIIIQDDGIGIPPLGQRNKGLGLFTMKNRANLINASLEITQNKQGGTDVKCLLGIN
jgi:signal transduction histidine kinase